MLDFGFSEILLTSAIALVVLGPERLPKVARQVGNWVGRARVMARQLTEQLEREVNADELMKQRAKAASPANASASATSTAAPGPVAPGPAPPSTAPPSAVPPVTTAPATTAAGRYPDPLPTESAPPAPAPLPRVPHPNSPEVMHAQPPPVSATSDSPPNE